jgi:hypothetical protein
MPSITISYRREDAAADAGRIYDRLARHYGTSSVFMDVTAIPYASDYRASIDGALRETDVVIAVVGPRWRGGDGPAARIMQPSDPVRVEIESALALKKIVLPVLVSGAKMPEPDELPPSLAAFHFLNAAPVDAGRDFDVHLQRLIEFIDGALRSLGRRVRVTRDEHAGSASQRPRWGRTAALGLRVAAGPIVAVNLAFAAFGLIALHDNRIAFWLQVAAAVAILLAGAGMLLLAAWFAGAARVRAGPFGSLDALQAGAAAAALGCAAFAFAVLMSVHVAATTFDGALLDAAPFRQWTSLLPPPQRTEIQLGVINRLHVEYNRVIKYRRAFTEADFTFARQMVAFIASFDASSGHVLYYDGQINHAVNARKTRVVKLMENVYVPWLTYLDNLRSTPEIDDFAHPGECYRTTGGYCRERSGFIRYLLGFTHYCASQELTAPGDAAQRVANLNEARDLLKASIAGWPKPFTIDGESHALLALIQHDIDALAHGRVPPKNPNPKACP